MISESASLPRPSTNSRSVWFFHTPGRTWAWLCDATIASHLQHQRFKSVRIRQTTTDSILPAEKDQSVICSKVLEHWGYTFYPEGALVVLVKCFAHSDSPKSVKVREIVRNRFPSCSAQLLVSACFDHSSKGKFSYDTLSFINSMRAWCILADDFKLTNACWSALFFSRIVRNGAGINDIGTEDKASWQRFLISWICVVVSLGFSGVWCDSDDGPLMNSSPAFDGYTVYCIRSPFNLCANFASLPYFSKTFQNHQLDCRSPHSHYLVLHCHPSMTRWSYLKTHQCYLRTSGCHVETYR